MPREKDQASIGYDQSSEIQALRAEIDLLRRVVNGVAQVTAIENVIQNGFSTLATQLQPLREIAPQRTALEGDGKKLLENVRAALDRPKWKSSGFQVDEKEKKDTANHHQTRSTAA